MKSFSLYFPKYLVLEIKKGQNWPFNIAFKVQKCQIFSIFDYLHILGKNTFKNTFTRPANNFMCKLRKILGVTIAFQVQKFTFSTFPAYFVHFRPFLSPRTWNILKICRENNYYTRYQLYRQLKQHFKATGAGSRGQKSCLAHIQELRESNKMLFTELKKLYPLSSSVRSNFQKYTFRDL